jgi:ATP-dependent DNA ligase
MEPFDRLAVKPGLPPMEAKLVDSLPDEEGWQFEPKWDGFRCLVYRAGDAVALQSKSGKPLERYFPEVVETVRTLGSPELVVDAELIIPVGGILSFEALQMRLHPAESRIRKLAKETPAQLMLFDCLLGEGGKSLVDRPLSERRAALEIFHEREGGSELQLSQATRDRGATEGWRRPGLRRRAPPSTASSPSASMDNIFRANGRC